MRDGFLPEEDDGAGVEEGAGAEVEEIADASFLAAGAQADEFLGEGPDGLALGVDHEADRAVETEADEGIDAGGHGCGEEHCLAGAGDGRQNLVEFVGESVVQHTVRFVEDEDLERVDGEIGGVAHVIDESARGGDDDVWALSEDGLLLAETEPSDELTEGDVGEGGEFLGNVQALDCEFAGGHQDGDTGCSDLLGAIEEAFEDGDDKGGGFAGARDSSTDEIFA